MHLVELDSRQWTDYLRFRDALRRNAQLLGEYERVKVELGARFCRDRASYTREKAEFICRVLVHDMTARLPLRKPLRIKASAP